MLTPDAVYVDLRTSPDAAATFLEALAPRKRPHPDVPRLRRRPEYDALPRARPAARPNPLDAPNLARVCSTILTPPAPEASARNGQSRVVRPLNSKATPTPAARKPISRRVLTKRR
jgi:hypothetical protein